VAGTRTRAPPVPRNAPAVVGHHAALAETRDENFFRIDRKPFQRVIDELPQRLRSAMERLDVGLLQHPGAQREPSVSILSAAIRHGDRTLRAEHHRLAVEQNGREPEKIMSAGPPAMEGDDRRKRTVSGGNVSCVEKIHRF
jgi:hypothetical protein